MVKKFLIITVLIICCSILSFARDNDFEANNFTSLKEFFQKNLNTLNPIEGIYHITSSFSCNDKLVTLPTEFDIFVIESESSNTVFNVLFLGYSDPFDGKPLPAETIQEEPGACIFAGYIFQDGNTNRYLFSFCPFGRNKAIAEYPFILDLGSPNFTVDFGTIQPKDFSYLNIPDKLRNKKINMSFKATKRYPL